MAFAQPAIAFFELVREGAPFKLAVGFVRTVFIGTSATVALPAFI